MYVPDQYAERAFYESLGFITTYEGDEFPGFLALQYEECTFGLQRASSEHPTYSAGMRWQFEPRTQPNWIASSGSVLLGVSNIGS